MSIDIHGCSDARCRWPLWGDMPRSAPLGAAARFCGSVTHGASSYCEDHHTIASYRYVQRRPISAARGPESGPSAVTSPLGSTTIATATATEPVTEEHVGMSVRDAEDFALMIESMKTARRIGLSPEEWQRRREAALTPRIFDRLLVNDPDGELPYMVEQREALNAKRAAISAARS